MNHYSFVNNDNKTSDRIQANNQLSLQNLVLFHYFVSLDFKYFGIHFVYAPIVMQTKTV